MNQQQVGNESLGIYQNMVRIKFKNYQSNTKNLAVFFIDEGFSPSAFSSRRLFMADKIVT